MLIEKFNHRDISNDELKRLILISEKIKNIDFISLNLNENMMNFKANYREHLFDFLTECVWGSQDINKLRECFTNRLSKKHIDVLPFKRPPYES